MFASMDNQTIRSMMAAQGMNLSDDQINLMKNRDLIKNAKQQMKNNPEIYEKVKQMKSSGINPSSQFNTNYSSNTNDQSRTSPTTNNTSVSSNSSNTNNNTNMNNVNPGSFPDMSTFPKNMDMKSMMDFVSKNPDMLKMISPQMAQMFGGNNGGDNKQMQSMMETIIWLFSLPQRIKKFCTSPTGLLIIGLFLYLIYNYFWG